MHSTTFTNSRGDWGRMDQVRKTKRKKLTSRVLTDTPVKEELRVQQTREEIKKRPIMNKRKLQQNKKNQISEESNRVTKKNKIKRQLYAEKDICVMCGEAGRDNEMWFRCRNCAKWAHELCTSVSSAVDYICEFCIHE
ncbi:hypothetical protein HELRODRAFT_160101 [Helobdella robusta]|uniref:Zinc finger PHD-type domain-containing protein n=1 Tax=Helobdella robusta TaxID=6412 RepID=T1EPS5_HELRO|nr:hypothetical protein HELRODRAFT_160101 [Helobdella robusta]ESO05996.1 hypothetical protein HELRODRAFT_160101 [Helobdella robusta]